MAELAQKSSPESWHGKPAYRMRIEEVARVDLYPTWELRKSHVPIFTQYFKSQKLAISHPLMIW